MTDKDPKFENKIHHNGKNGTNHAKNGNHVQNGTPTPKNVNK